MFRKSVPLLLALTSFGLAATYQSALHLLPYPAKTGAKAYYASNTGKSSAAGTLAAPYDLVTGLAKLSAGDTLYVRGGTYARTTTLTVGTSNGNANSGHTHVFAYKSEKPVLDFTGMAVADANRGLQINGSYWYFKGFEVMNAGDNGVFIAGNYNVIESFSIHGNFDTGLQISRNSSSQATIDQWPKFNLIKNTDSYNNSDVLGENADGFAAKLTVGEGNAFTNCVSHHNSDDGWDLYTKTATGAIGTVTIDRCVAHHNGVLLNGTKNVNGDRNGFTWNSNPGQIILANNLAIDNADNKSNVWWNSSKAAGATSINAKGLKGYTDDFAISLAFITGVSRLADGSIDFSVFALASSSDLINANAYVCAPDIGPVEYGAVVISSSSVAVSSSSSSAASGSCIAFVNGVGGYGDHCYKSGLNYMATGTCANHCTKNHWPPIHQKRASNIWGLVMLQDAIGIFRTCSGWTSRHRRPFRYCSTLPTLDASRDRVESGHRGY